ncbi:uncharacterized protein LOC123268160 [Cotesia glomerata]|uniref:uncharacterized protein LOC123268160 n=1 Tax=Cotesia glomerata TaxID=32391 RepID=UPI001D001B8F|nr:uncharacterized protein LOC123268160 [Cotesia glomerata]
MHSGESKSLNHKLTINCTQYGMHSNSANYEQNKDLGLGFNNKLIKYQQQDNGNPIELYEGSSKHFGHMTEENFVEVRDKNSAINKQSHEQFGQSSEEHKSSYGYQAHSSETGYGNHDNSEGSAKYELADYYFK